MNANVEFVKKLRDDNIANVIDETKRLKDIEEEILRIDIGEIKNLDSKINKLKNFQEYREILIQKYHDSISDLRIKRLNRCYQSTKDSVENYVKISVDKKQNTKYFNDFLHELLAGKNIKNLNNQIENICNKINSVYDLIILLKGKKIEEISSRLAITENTATVILSSLSDDIGICNYLEDLLPVNLEQFRLELLSFDDVVHIEGYDIAADKYKDIRRFSQGQQCSFLLSLLMASSQNNLVIDQPDDDLDWNYIKEFIEKLKSLKINNKGNGRQFIFATHNQNITVLADSEKIYYLNNKSTDNDGDVPSGEIKACGGLDRLEVKNAVLALEGGEDAFNLRGKKYGIK